MLRKEPTRTEPTPSARGRRALTLAALLIATAVLGLAQAGNLEPPGPPGPTMKTLDEIPPTWNQFLPADDGEANGCNSSRFRCTGPYDQLVLDLQTGLVWQRALGVSNDRDWSSARRCLLIGDGGSRLASVTELGTLKTFGPSADGFGLPVGHPFIIRGNPGFDLWTMTTSAEDPTRAFFYRLDNNTGSASPQEAPKTALKQWLCVRTPSPGLAVY